MGYYEMVARTMTLSFGIAGVMSFMFGFLGSVYVEETENKSLRKILRIGNIELHILAALAVFIITEGAPIGIRLSVVWGAFSCLCIDLLVCRNAWLYNWMIPKKEEED